MTGAASIEERLGGNSFPDTDLKPVRENIRENRSNNKRKKP